mmetsp:Transcript_22715/g.49939  ORF Transcript_22715/g.49939 Transcript_22715/m.49939 type:complete len:1788 (-) Transcript_22715:450-5813(-)
MPPKKSKEDQALEDLRAKQVQMFNECLTSMGGKLFPNMDELPILTEEYVLANLHNLYHKEQPTDPKVPHNFSTCYAQVGPILLALNPFKRLDCYGKNWQEAFHALGVAGQIVNSWKTLGPHCFCTIETAYQNLRRTGRNQAVVICGESGAGKTWTAKLMLDYLLDMAAQSGGGDTGSKKEILEMCNVVLEAFGNAKTQRNDNSSRFGKFTQLFFDDNYLVTGATFDHYLLERSRVVKVPDLERNYHILHYISKDEEVKCGKKFNYLGVATEVKRASEVEVNGKKTRDFDDVGDFNQLKVDMAKACFPLDVQEVLYDFFRGCLYLGNVTFEGDDEGAVAKATMADYDRGLELLGLLHNKEKMTFALTHKEIKVAKDINIAPINGKDSTIQKDNVVKTIYSRLFDWIVAQMNKAMAGLESQYGNVGTVGLLDIFGFEDLVPNGFEQMFINLTNERIQHHFNNIMFDSEVRLYEEEGINITMESPDNSQAILLFTANKNSIISHLNECIRGKKEIDGEKFRATLDTACSIPKNKGIYCPIDMKNLNEPRDGFKVCHYAGTITYRCMGFIDKSKDSCALWCVEQMGVSTRTVPPNPMTRQPDEVNMMNELFPEELAQLAEGNRDSSGASTVGETFKVQLAALMNNKLGAFDAVFGTRPPDVDPRVDSVFVRCIKPRPNSLSKFDQAMVRNQLVTGGVMAALKIRELGMPDRMEFDDFVKEFFMLLRNDTGTNPEKTKQILTLFYPEFNAEGECQYKCGKTKVFMKSGILTSLREITDVVIKRCAKVVMYKWRAKTGLDMLTELNQMKGRIEALNTEAISLGVDKVQVVEKNVQLCGAELDKAFDTLKLDPEAFDRTVAALNKRQNRQAIRRGTEMAISDRIGFVGAFSRKDFQALSGKVEEAKAKIAEVVNTRRAAVDKIDAMLIPCFQEIDALVNRVDEVMRYCKSDDPPERGGDLWKSCNNDKESLGRIVNEDFKTLAKEILETVDLNTKDPVITMPQKAKDLVARGEALVQNTEKAGADLVLQRKHFEFEQMCATPELKALTEKKEQAKERIDCLDQDFDTARKQGLTSVTDLLTRALEAEKEVDDSVREALSSERYAAGIEKYLEVEKELQEAVAIMKALEQEKLEREVKARKKIFDGFTQSRELLQVYFEFVNHIDMFQTHLEKVSGVGDTDGLGTTKEKVDALMSKMNIALDSMDSMQVEAMIDEQAGEKIRFNYKGEWSPECFKLLGSDITDYQHMAPLLDEERCTDVVDAVELLNSGLMPIDGGYCISWSKVWGQYYLLFKKTCETEAITALNRTRMEIDMRIRATRRKAVQDAVSGALEALGADQLAKQVSDDQAALEAKIREQMKNELEPGYVQRARDEVDAKTDKVREEVRVQVDAAEGRYQEALSEQLAAQESFQSRIDDLSAQLEKCKINTGIKGLVPSLHRQLSDVGTYCTGLLQNIEHLRDLTTGELDGIEEALAHMDALTNNPRTLPGLRDFVKVLGRLQVNHAQSENMCQQLGLEGQLTALKEARDQMAEAAAKVKKICEGQVTLDNGLEEELKFLKADLRICAKSFDMLRRVFFTWHTRLAKAGAFIERALECIDNRLDTVADLKERPRPQKKSSLWDKVVTGVTDNLCSSAQRGEGRAMNAANFAHVKLAGSKPASPGSKSEGERPWKDPSYYSQQRKNNKYNINVGDFVQDMGTPHNKGIVRYTGLTDFAGGEWVGIELEGPYGKNDGSVNGKQYFQCEPDFGIFLRPNSLAKVYQPSHRHMPRTFTSHPGMPASKVAPFADVGAVPYATR